MAIISVREFFMLHFQLFWKGRPAINAQWQNVLSSCVDTYNKWWSQNCSFDSFDFNCFWSKSSFFFFWNEDPICQESIMIPATLLTLLVSLIQQIHDHVLEILIQRFSEFWNISGVTYSSETLFVLTHWRCKSLWYPRSAPPQWKSGVLDLKSSWLESVCLLRLWPCWPPLKYHWWIIDIAH